MPEFVVAAALLSAIGIFGASWWGRRAAGLDNVRHHGRWERTVFDDGCGGTVVAIRRVVRGRTVNEICVDVVSNGDPDWRSKLLTAQAEAAERIATLEAEG